MAERVIAVKDTAVSTETVKAEGKVAIDEAVANTPVPYSGKDSEVSSAHASGTVSYGNILMPWRSRYALRLELS